MGTDASPPPAEALADLALLASMSAVVHYFWGVWGILAALALAAVLEHGPAAYSAAAAALRPASVHGSAAALWPHDRGHEREDGDAQEEARRDAAARPSLTSASTAPPSLPPPATGALHGRRRDTSASRLRIRDVGSRPRSGEVASLCANSPAPIPFETELFAGRVLFLVRAPSADAPHAALFHGKRRMFWIQVQGRFKRAPRGAVYLGGELPACIAPGFFAKSLALVILGLIRQLLPVSDVHFSFGDEARGGSGGSGGGGSARQAARELPAIAFPLFQSVDQFVETAEGEEPPALGSADFGESLESRQRRRQTPLGAERFLPGRTYSFHFHTMYVDLARWETVNLPGLRAMDLSTFFDALPLRLVAYDVARRAAGADRHAQADKDYLFSFEIQYERHRPPRGAATRAAEPASDRSAAALDRALAAPAGSDLSTRSSTIVSDELVSDADEDNLSSSLSAATGELDGSVRRQHRAFLARENARRLARLAPAFLCWMEELDVDSGVRGIHYVFSVRGLSESDEGDESPAETQEEAASGRPSPRDGRRGQRRLAIVSAHALRSALAGRGRGKRAEGHYGSLKLPREEEEQEQEQEGSASARRRRELAALRLHTRSRIGSYSAITDEVLAVVDQLQALLLPSSRPRPRGESDAWRDRGAGDRSSEERRAASNDVGVGDGRDALEGEDEDEDEDTTAARAALFQALLRRQWLQSPEATAASMSPSRLGVNLSRREREELGVVFEGVVYRYHADALLRQEVLQLSADALLFFRSYAAQPHKRVATESVIGVRAIPVPLLAAAATDGAGAESVGAFALEISTLGEQLALCLGTKFARDAWLRVLEQHCEPCRNATKWLAPAALAGRDAQQRQAQAEQQQLRACRVSSGARLLPSQRVVLNSWSLFPSADASPSTSPSPASEAEEAARSVELVAQTLRQALAIHATHDAVTTMAPAAAPAEAATATSSTKQVLAFLERASAVRAVDLELVQAACSHEQQLALYLNLFHLILAHAMMAHGVPRGRRAWDAFLRAMSYSLRRRRRPQPEQEEPRQQQQQRPLQEQEGYAQVTVSLAELEHLLLRARMPRADVPHLRVAALAREPSARRLAGLGLRHPDFRASLALATNRPVAARSRVRVFDAGAALHAQLNAVAAALLCSPGGRVEVREAARVVRLPRVCDWYRRDFGGAPLDALRKLLGFLPGDAQRLALRLLERDQPVHIEYRAFRYEPMAVLLLDEDGAPSEDADDEDASEQAPA